MFLFCVLNAIKTLLLAEQWRKRCEETCPFLSGSRARGATARRKRAGCATHFGIRSPAGTALLFLVCAFLFLPPAPGAFFVLALFSLEAPSLHGWPGRGRNLRLLLRSSRPFGRSPSWKYPPSCSHFASCSLIVLVLAYGTPCVENELF